MPRESKLFIREVELDASRSFKVTINEDPTLDIGGGETAWCAWCLWPAAKVLVRYLAVVEDSELKGQSVLELGSGLGAVGMYLAHRGASPVVVTDTHKALPLLKRNVLLNRASCEVACLPWGAPLANLAESVRNRVPFDWVVASDCTYDFVSPEKPSPTTDALLATMRSCARRCLICVSNRTKELAAFEVALDRAGLKGLATVVFQDSPGDIKKECVDVCWVYFIDFSGSEGVPKLTEESGVLLQERTGSREL
eukprot:TRINITY_DN41708_c2_g1_i1.p1 TRINITY_DN41708_c2_g1~~TRINITY_DN41708_c2_g1_i1.p1  ORF type:complete len:274 (-),score=25.71 TRINITY_DN41708_c2_g1_i1:17-775(-)